MAITPGSYRRGTVLAGGEYGDRGSAYENATAAGGMSYTNPGVYGDDYVYPTAGDFAYIKSRTPTAPIGKLMVRMERLTTGLSGPLRAVEVPRIQAVLDGAQAAGVGIILCPWNFGAVWTGTTTTTRRPLGGTMFTSAAFNDFWVRVLTEWGDHPALIGVDLMTEPVSLPGGAAGWETITQSALDTIRTFSSTLHVWVPNYGWAINEINAHTSGPWINDPTGNYGYAGHQYSYNQGGTEIDYAATLQSAINQGWTAGSEIDAVHAREVAAANEFATWLGGETGFISEYGFPGVETTGVTAAVAQKWAAFGERMLDVYDTHQWWATAWTSGRVTAPGLVYTLYYPSAGWDRDIDAATSIASVIEAHPSVVSSGGSAQNVNIGSIPVSSIRLGDLPINRVYQGNNLIYDAATSAPVLLGMQPTSQTQAQQDSAVRTLWTAWKGHLRQDTTKGWYAVLANAQPDPVTGVPENPYVAEGQGYGMMLSAQMAPYDANARTIFDGITQYVLDHPSVIDPRLHAAQQDINMVNRGGGDCATDGDMDIAMGLLMAHQRWGSSGKHNYLSLAKTRITAIKESLISPKTGLLEMGDWSGDYSGSGDRDWTVISRPSDWMIGHFEAFRNVTGDTAWDTIKTDHLSAINRLQTNYAPATGLIPDFTVGAPATITPAPPNTLETAYDGAFYYNACRVPWRLGVASDIGARTAAAKMAAWAETRSAGVPANIPAGAELDGTTIPGSDYADMSFIAPFAVAASTSDDQAWLNSLWDYLAADASNTDYYSGSIQLMCMIYLSRTYYLDASAPALTDATVRSVSSASVPYNTASKTITKPAGTAAGDLLLLVAHCDYGSAADFKVPTGFTTLLTKELSANGDKQLIGYKIAAASEPGTYTLTVPVDADLRADLLCIQGADTGTSPVLSSAATPLSATSHTAPSVTPLSNRGLLVASASLSAGNTGNTFAWTPPVGMTEHTDTATNGFVTLTTASAQWSSTSPTGARNFALSMSATAKQALTASIIVPSGTSGGDTPAPAPEPEPAPTPTGYTPVGSNGSNGSYTDAITSNRTFSDGANTSEYRIWVSHVDRTKPVPLVIHFHGDGAYEYENPTTWTSPQYMQVAKDIGGIGVIPNAVNKNTNAWWSGTAGANWAIALIRDLMGKYNIDKRRIFLSGFSGGAVLIAEDIMVKWHTDILGGGAMMLGGGQPGTMVGTPSAQLLRDFPMRWHVGTNDTAANAPDGYDGRGAAEQGEAFYRGYGFDTRLTYIQGENHNQSENDGPAALQSLVNESQTLYGLTSI